MIKDSFDRKSFKELYAIEEDSFWFQSRNELILYLISKYFKYFNNYLEIGCGTGNVLNAIKNTFPNKFYLGIELYEEGLYYARKRMPKVEFIKQDATKIEYKNQFDLIGSFDVLEHIKEDEKVLSNMFRACQSGGGYYYYGTTTFVFMESDGYRIMSCTQIQ